MATKRFYGYYIVAAGGLVQLFYLGGIFTYGVLFPHLEAEFGWSAALISGAGSLMFFFMCTLSAVMGFVNDRLGPRVVMTTATICFGSGFMLLSTVDTAWQLYLYYGLLCGIGMGAHDVVLLSTVARWFTKHRGMMSGLVKAGGGVGQVLVPIGAATLIVLVGWRDAMLYIGFILLVGMVISCQLLYRDPQERGLRPLGENTQSDHPISVPEIGATVYQAIRRYQFWLLCCAKLTDFYCVTSIMVHIVRYGLIKGLSPSSAALLISCIGGFSIVGRLTFGIVFDRIGSRGALSVCFAILLFSIVMLQFIETPRLLFLFTVFYGFAHGGFFVIASPSVAEFFGTRSHGTIFGLIFLAGTFGAVTGPLFTGWIFDVTGNYRIAFQILTALSLLGLIFALSLKPFSSHKRIG